MIINIINFINDNKIDIQLPKVLKHFLVKKQCYPPNNLLQHLEKQVHTSYIHCYR